VAPSIKLPLISHGPIIQPISVSQKTVSVDCTSKHWAMSWAPLIGKPPWTCSTPLGRPVVPDV
jgi:hypothetical protein